MTERDLKRSARKALADGFKFAVTHDSKGEVTIVSCHKDYEAARNAMMNGRGNTVYELKDLAR